MAEVKIIKATKGEKGGCGRAVEQIRVAAYCRVSTDSEDQMNSYNSQVTYYTDLINQNPKWEMVDIYADAAITGTQVDKRDGLQSMISDCLNGRIDQIITKSISRFARNTVDTLKYVRLLKENNVAVVFEDEGINTMTMDGELLLTVLSSVAQQEVENISANVKKGLKMKMQRGELVGFNGCVGYTYDPDTKTITVNEKERHIIEYIFDRYVQGAGCGMIARELTAMGEKKRDGTSDWKDSHVRSIIANAKYKGDLVMGRTFTADPISKKRLKNLGEEDMYYVENNHEPIISRELFDLAQEIRKKRGGKNVNARHQPAYKHYAFSGVLKCGFCGCNLTRKTMHGNDKKYVKVIWECMKYIKEGKKSCPRCKALREEMIEEAFLECYKHLCHNYKDLVEKAIDEAFGLMESLGKEGEIETVRREILRQRDRKQKLIDLSLSGSIEDESFRRKMSLIDAEMTNLNNRLRYCNAEENMRDNRKKELQLLKNRLKHGVVLEKFDRRVFESIVEAIIVGGYDDDGNALPYNMTFILKTGNHFTEKQSAPVNDLDTTNTDNTMIELFKFKSHWRYVNFPKGKDGRRKQIHDETDVSVVVRIS